jgi:hypothetical protein
MGKNRNAYRESQKERDHQEDLDVDWRIILGWSGMDWTDLPQNRGQWRAVVNTIMNLRVPKKWGIF